MGVSNLMQVSHPEAIYPLYDRTAEVVLAILPFFHIFGMSMVMNLNLRHGGKLITLPKFEPGTFTSILEKHQPTCTSLVPPLMTFMATHPKLKSHHLASFRKITGGAAPFGVSLIKKFKEKAKPNKIIFNEGFGLTESSPALITQPNNDQIEGACGFLVPNTIAKVIDIETGENLGPNCAGELLVAGPQIMKGYYKNDKATNRTIKNGWLYTGDLSKYDEKGNFYIIDRLKELIKVRGLQVAPSELENLIRQYPGVIDVAVIGILDEKSGDENPRAYVVRENRRVLEKDIINFVDDKVARHKRLRAGVIFVESLPKNQTGKILRRELKAQI